MASELTFQSPVWKMVPSLHLRTSAQQSGMECVTRIGSISKGPASKRARILKVRSLPSSGMLYSLRRFLISFKRTIQTAPTSVY